ncbi:MAG TPA: type II secretion system secretin GspD [Rhodopila sp.]|uniref:type II secretion system secretin GspD n=1 Tax=Rhodopila sp. TaxID=2480087 RepID=UPI002B8F9C5D|nr:type II secretion system secretin GspD [Rhodopila sp.]HVY17110.1 type II secretion system secretin GspD [Rhodopila sp.]
MKPHHYLALIALLLIVDLTSGCTREDRISPPPIAESASDLVAAQRINGSVSAQPTARPIYSYGTPPVTGTLPQGPNPGPGPYTLEFTDTDVREVVAQILGTILHVNYTIDPAVHGTVTLHTGQSLSGRQLLPTLQNLLATVGAVVIADNGLFRVVPISAAGAAGSLVLPLHYVSAEDLAKVLQPVAGPTTKITAEPGLNALLINGDPVQVQAVREMVESFDQDELAHQSYALLPVANGSAREFADAMQEAFRGKAGGGLAGLVRVVPLVRLNAVLIVSSQPRYIDAARQVFSLIEQQRHGTTRSWHVYYLQNSNANDVAYTLQTAFTPNNVTAAPSAKQQNGGGRAGLTFSGSTGAGSNLSTAGIGSSTLGSSAQASGGVSGGLNPLAPSGADANRSVSASPTPAAGNPLLGGLETGSASDTGDSMRILPNNQNNAVLIYATPQEEDQVVGILHKIDILPLQVEIDATIAEVTLNDTLQYGTQFFFKSGGINGILSTGTAALTSPSTAGLNSSFPGFILSGSGQGGVPFALSALQAVTRVNVLSSPQITVVDNQTARLQVGSLVPYLLSSSQSTLTTGSPVINSIGYQPTGVILEVTPRVNSGGLITLDISQEVSDVAATVTTSGIQSPTFTERNVSSRVVVQDGQTVGMAGLIQDSISKGNQGIPWLKDIPILGALVGTQNNTRQRTELLVLITPHVIPDQSKMRRLTEDMRDALSSAAAVPTITANEPISGSSDPNGPLRARIRRLLEKRTHP